MVSLRACALVAETVQDARSILTVEKNDSAMLLSRHRQVLPLDDRIPCQATKALKSTAQ